MKTLGPLQKTIVGAQFLFVAFGATVLVPLLIGLDPSVALMTAGVGTLIFHAVTKGKVPIFLGSSFAFVSLTKIADPAVIRIAAVFGIVFSVLGKVSAFLKSIPEAVLGGIMLLLFGTIASVGVNTLIKNQVDFGKTRNLVIASLILTTGIGGAEMSIGSITIGGIGLAALIGVILNLIIPDKVE